MVTVWQCDQSKDTPRLTLVEMSPLPASLDAASHHLPPGAYTTLRTYMHDKVIRFADHLERLAISAQLKGLYLGLDDRKIRQAIRVILHEFDPEQDIRLRITLDFSQNPGAIYLAAEPLRVPAPEAYLQGVAVVTCGLQRHDPQAKLTDFIDLASRYRLTLPVGVEEALMVDSEGRILEGLSSNFFAVRQSALYTTGEGVLAGITRTLVLQAAQEVRIPAEFQAVLLAEIPECQEAFITSASRGILPVTSVDRIRLGGGFPGQVTRQLMAGFDRLVLRELEPV